MVAMIIPQPQGQILAVSVNGYGKRTTVAEFPVKGRGGQGVIGIQASKRNGAIVSALQVFDGDEIMLISDKGTLVRIRVDEISVQGRNTQGVRLIKLKEGENLCGVERVEEPDDAVPFAEVFGIDNASGAASPGAFTDNSDSDSDNDNDDEQADDAEADDTDLNSPDDASPDDE